MAVNNWQVTGTRSILSKLTQDRQPGPFYEEDPAPCSREAVSAGGNNGSPGAATGWLRPRMTTGSNAVSSDHSQSSCFLGSTGTGFGSVMSIQSRSRPPNRSVPREVPKHGKVIGTVSGQVKRPAKKPRFPVLLALQAWALNAHLHPPAGVRKPVPPVRLPGPTAAASRSISL